LKLPGRSREETTRIIPKGVILSGFVGSTAHGTYVPKEDPNSIDDKDVMCVGIWDKDFYLGLPYNYETHRAKRDVVTVMEGEWDVVTYELRKVIKLLLKQNPNVLSLLWLQEKDYIYVSDLGRKLLDNRNLFTSKIVYQSFVRYAKDQLYKMTHGSFEEYMGKKRKELVTKFGIDTKNAGHLIRLLRRGIEYLTDGTLHVFCHDNQELKAIKKGEWSLEQIKAEADRLFILASEAFVRSPLPATPDYAKAEKLCIEIIEEYHSWKNH
jgi:predicted nucleotidyltransferase